MSELQDKVSQELQNDAEHARITFLKHQAYGRRLQAEDMSAEGFFDKATVDQMCKDAISATAKLIFEKLDALEAQVNAMAMQVELESEKEALELLRQEFLSRPEGLAALLRVDAIIKDVDAKHTAIIKDVRAPGILAIKAEYGV